MQAAYDEILSFITSGPSLEAIANFQHSAETLRRVAYLQRKAQQAVLSPQEAQELREFRRAEYLVDMLRVRAIRRLGMETW
jgi:hypothetical protein